MLNTIIIVLLEIYCFLTVSEKLDHLDISFHRKSIHNASQSLHSLNSANGTDRKNRKTRTTFATFSTPLHIILSTVGTTHTTVPDCCYYRINSSPSPRVGPPESHTQTIHETHAEHLQTRSRTSVCKINRINLHERACIWCVAEYTLEQRRGGHLHCIVCQFTGSES